MRPCKQFADQACPYLRKAAYARVRGQSWNEIAYELNLPRAQLKAMVILLPTWWKKYRKLAEDFNKMAIRSGLTPVDDTRGPRIIQVETS